MTAEKMTPEQRAFLTYTVSHFQEVARQNRFAENGTIDHDTDRCTVCRPELLPLDPFETYLEVVTQSVKIRRPRLDEELVHEINNDLALMGQNVRVSLESIIKGQRQAVDCWSDWLRDALSTGLGLLSIHSAASYDFSLDDPEARDHESLIERKIQELMDFQMENRRIDEIP